MGLTLHLNLFRDVHHDVVLQSLQECHSERGFDLRDEEDRDYCYQLHEMENGWVVLELPIGWNWAV